MFDLLFNFNGRIARLVYFFATLIMTIFFLIFLLFVKNSAVTYAGVLVCLYCVLVLQVKRWHDIGLSGWFVLLGLVPIIGTISGLYCLFKGGENGTNKYGEAP